MIQLVLTLLALFSAGAAPCADTSAADVCAAAMEIAPSAGCEAASAPRCGEVTSVDADELRTNPAPAPVLVPSEVAHAPGAVRPQAAAVLQPLLPLRTRALFLEHCSLLR